MYIYIYIERERGRDYDQRVMRARRAQVGREVGRIQSRFLDAPVPECGFQKNHCILCNEYMYIYIYIYLCTHIYTQEVFFFTKPILSGSGTSKKPPRDTVAALIELLWLEKAYRGPQITGMRVKNGGTVSSNSRFQTVLF